MTLIGRLIGALVLSAVSLAVPTPANAGGCTAYLDTRVGIGYVRSSPAIFHTANVWVYGDSITVQSWRNLSGIAVDARWGRATSPTVTQLGVDVHSHPGDLPAVVVIAVGTNDVADPTVMHRQVQLARAVLPLTVKVLWVNVYATTTPAWAAVNAQLAGVPGVAVLDWAGLVLARPGLLDATGFHVTVCGAYWRTQLIHHYL